MKKFSEILPAWEVDTEAVEDPEEWNKGKLLLKLRDDGHTAIAVDRATIVIEQCEHGDEFPQGWSEDPIKLSIYSDPDATYSFVPEELYVNGGRHGLMDVYLKTHTDNDKPKVFRFVPVDVETVTSLQSSASTVVQGAAVAALLKGYLSGYYSVQRGEKAAGAEYDETLAALAEDVHRALDRYLNHLNSLPNLYTEWRE